MGGVPKNTRESKPTPGAPPEGWIRTMRNAHGVSLRQLGAKLGIKGNSVHVAERREVEGGISIYQLRRLANALDCDLFYAFVPKKPGEARPSKAYAQHVQQLGDASGGAPEAASEPALTRDAIEAVGG